MMIQDLPGDARIVKHFNDGRPRWDDHAYLLSDVVHVLSGKEHPARPNPRKQGIDVRETPERARLRRQRIAAKRRREKRALTSTQPSD
ncbi:hypothetical protein G4X40_18535 [Rhodococcus sp. D2-41]|uniref:hypothetical protein n=1 Tax=Speluncibacter jeojiensis TaxID=2710754 RepID=UPI00240EBFB9|nr:hypothetical protein [Rhodococcus sp. D2-41]MDG3012143.1 hypothetical protein [Rhodococcus sp. D2-41]